MTPLAIFGIDIGDLVADLLRSLLDLLVPDFAARWGSQLASWMVALPNVADGRQFAQLNAFRHSLTHAAWGLLSLSFAVGALQYWATGFAEQSRAGALDAVRRAVIAAAALAAYPTVIAQLVLAVNNLTAAVVRHPKVVDGLDLALGGALALGALSSGLSLGLALAAVIAAVFFLAALAVMKIALTAMLCIVVVSGAVVIALYPMPLGESLVRVWLSGLMCAIAVPVVWAMIFAVAGLVSSDALAWSGGLGEGLAALVKPFVAVACLYLAYRAPALLVAQARMLGLRLDIAGGMRGSPGQQRLHAVARQQRGAYSDRFARLGAMAARPMVSGVGRVAGAAARQTGGVGRAARRFAASGAVSAAAAGGNERRGERIVGGVNAATAAAGAAGRAGRAAGRAARQASDWWRRPGSAETGPASGARVDSAASGASAGRGRRSRPHSSGGTSTAGRRATDGGRRDAWAGLHSRGIVVRRRAGGGRTHSGGAWTSTGTSSARGVRVVSNARWSPPTADKRTGRGHGRGGPRT